MSATPRHGVQEPGAVPWLSTIHAAPPAREGGTGPGGSPARPAASSRQVVTRPSIPRIALGVFLGLVLFTAALAAVGAALVAFGLVYLDGAVL